MADIMIDNWTLQRAAISINDTYEKISSPNEEYVKLIEALVLWDHVYFIDNEYSQYWKKFLYRFGYEKYLSPFAIDIFYHGQSRIIQIKYGHMQCAVSAGSAQPIGYLRPARTVHNNFQFNETKRQCRYISYIEVYMQRTNFLHSAERLFLSVFSSYICSAISDMNS